MDQQNVAYLHNEIFSNLKEWTTKKMDDSPKHYAQQKGPGTKSTYRMTPFTMKL